MSGFSTGNANDNPRVLNVTVASATTSLNLANVDYVQFNTAGAGTVTAVTNVIVGKRYLLYNFGVGAWTISRSCAYMPGAVDGVLSTNYVIDMLGVGTALIAGTGPISNNG